LPIICKATTGFVYYVSREGVTGERASMAEGIGARVAAIRTHTQLPVVVGFGISTAEHVRAISEVADGVVVGSALVNCIANNPGNGAAATAALREKMHALVG
jgi:tryptophan synthase alpha chain